MPYHLATSQYLILLIDFNSIYSVNQILRYTEMVMPVVDMRQFNKRSSKRVKHRRKWLLLIGCALVIFVLVTQFMSRDSRQNVTKPSNNEQRNLPSSTVPNTGAVMKFTGEQFKELARSVKYPNTQLFLEPPYITGDSVADARIRKLAEERGYVMTSIPETSIEKINEPRLENDDLLQPLAAIAWRDLKAAARRDSIPLTLISAYRSPEYQRNLFMGRLKSLGVTTSQIVSGDADAKINTILSQAAVPGYSRHHTGYTIDLWCEDGSSAFLSSKCFDWISKDNYYNAKITGWIPSYPDGAGSQGPEPEPWEYVWVGKELVVN